MPVAVPFNFYSKNKLQISFEVDRDSSFQVVFVSLFSLLWYWPWAFTAVFQIKLWCPISGVLKHFELSIVLHKHSPFTNFHLGWRESCQSNSGAD